MKCSQCGNEVENPAQCPFCGAARSGNEDQYQNSVPYQGEPMHQAGNQTMQQQKLRSRIVAGLLGIFLGGWGVHNFYLGYMTKAIIQLSVTVGASLFMYSFILVTAGLSLLTFIPITIGIWIWGFVEGILILCGCIRTDGSGRPLRT